MAQPRKEPYIWASWLSKVMAGEITCEWQSWFKGHYSAYEKAPNDFDQPKWMQEHTELLRQITAELRADGHTVSLESQNKFHYKTRDGVLIGCNPDLIAIKNRSAVIWDAKTGNQRPSDLIQVMLYQLMAPSGCPALTGFGGSLSGMLFYGKTTSRVKVPIPDAAFIDRVRRACLLFTGSKEPLKAPGQDCMWCDIGKSECPERIDKQRRQKVGKGIL